MSDNNALAIQRGNTSYVLGNTILHTEGLKEIFEFATYVEASESSQGSET